MHKHRTMLIAAFFGSTGIMSDTAIGIRTSLTFTPSYPYNLPGKQKKHRYKHQRVRREVGELDDEPLQSLIETIVFK